jgi:hypothetical protein
MTIDPDPVGIWYPTSETETEFWRRKALERSQEIARLRRQVAWLKDAIAVYEEES